MPTFENQSAGRARNQIWNASPNSARRLPRRRGAGKLKAELGGFDHRQELGRQTLGPGTPIIHFDQWEQDGIEIKLIPQGRPALRKIPTRKYAVPVELPHLGRARSQPRGAVRKCILHARSGQAQGQGAALRVLLASCVRRRPHIRVSSRPRNNCFRQPRRCKSRSEARRARGVDHVDGERHSRLDRWVSAGKVTLIGLQGWAR